MAATASPPVAGTGPRPALRGRPAWGLAAAAVACFLIHGIHRGLWQGHPEDLLWACHLSNLLVALGCGLASGRWVAVGLLWLLTGNLLWVVDLCSGSAFQPPSLSTHWGGLAVAVVAQRRYGLRRGAWWRAVAAFAGLLVVSRFITPVAANVNVSHRVHVSAAGVTNHHALYVVVCLAVGAATLYLVERFALRRLFFATTPRELAPPAVEGES